MAERSKRKANGQCRRHPRYMAKLKPRPTNQFPKGCPTCWEIYKEKHKTPEKKKAVVKKAKPVPPKGKQFSSEYQPKQFSNDIQGYIQKKTRGGRALVDVMLVIAGVKKGKDQPAAQNKDVITAIKWLGEAGFDVEEDKGDKDRPIQIVNYGELYVGPRPPS